MDGIENFLTDESIFYIFPRSIVDLVRLEMNEQF